MSLLSMCREAALQCNVDVPAAVVGAPNGSTGALMLRLAREEAESLMRRYPWQVLQFEKVFATSATDEQVGAVPDDFDRMVPETMFNRTRNRYVAGPISAAEWQRTKSSLVTTVNPLYRMRGNRILFTPQQAAGEMVAYEYISKNWARSADGVAQSDWLTDSDVFVIDERLMTLGLVWRFLEAKGLSYAEERDLYERRVMDAEMRDGGAPRISTDPDCVDRYPTRLQIPDTWNIS